MARVLAPAKVKVFLAHGVGTGIANRPIPRHVGRGLEVRKHSADEIEIEVDARRDIPELSGSHGLLHWRSRLHYYS
jgi:hypothetical protein